MTDPEYAYHWTDDAQCRSDEGRRAMSDAIDFPRSEWASPAAKAFCRRCLVQRACLADNLDLRWGVVGNTDEVERARYRRRIHDAQVKKEKAKL